MPRNNMTASEIQDELIKSVGETGNAKVKSGGLYVQREENADWQFIGSVEDADEAKAAVRDYFNQ